MSRAAGHRDLPLSLPLDVPKTPTTAEIDICDPAVAAAALALQRRSYMVEAQLIGSDMIPPLKETPPYEPDYELIRPREQKP